MKKWLLCFMSQWPIISLPLFCFLLNDKFSCFQLFWNFFILLLFSCMHVVSFYVWMCMCFFLRECLILNNLLGLGNIYGHTYRRRKPNVRVEKVFLSMTCSQCRRRLHCCWRDCKLLPLCVKLNNLFWRKSFWFSQERKGGQKDFFYSISAFVDVKQ